MRMACFAPQPFVSIVNIIFGYKIARRQRETKTKGERNANCANVGDPVRICACA